MKSVKKALAAAFISVACGSAAASTVPTSFVDVVVGTNQDIHTWNSVTPPIPYDPSYYELRVGADSVTATFTLMDTDTEGFTVNYELYKDTDGSDNSFTLGALVSSWSFADLAGAGGTFVKTLAANTQYVLRMATNGSVASTTNLTASAVPLPAAAWLFGSALLGLGIFRRRKQAAAV